MNRLGFFWVAASLSLSEVSAQGRVDFNALWNFRDPAASEARFRAALAGANQNDAFVLHTQIARTMGLRREFARARAHLQSLVEQLPHVSGEARARYWLEWGRTWASATHQDAERDVSTAREAYTRVMDIAKAEGLDGLYVDAVHMMAFVDIAPQDQLRWGTEALKVVLASKQPEAKRWEASIRNNLGVAHRALGANEQALNEFERAVSLREQLGNAGNLRFAWFMVGRTLRELGRIEEALKIQTRMDRESVAANDVDPSVLDELIALYERTGDRANAAATRARRATIK